MAESSKKSNINFIKLNTEELSSKIALLVSNKSRVIFWKTSPKYYEGQAFNFNVGKKIKLEISNIETLVSFNDEKICLNFVVNEMDYFLRGIVVYHDSEKKILQLELDESCFRFEKRTKERLVTYPAYEVYAYIKYQREFSPNIIMFNKEEQKNKDFFSVIDNLQKNKIVSLAKDLEMDDEEDLVGFRVEDISSNGVSFFSNQKEKEMILDNLEDKNFSIVLNFEGQVFTLVEASFVYKMNYIHPQFLGIPMYKVGIQFKASPSLKRKIEEISGIVVDINDYQKEFEEFIKNE